MKIILLTVVLGLSISGVFAQQADYGLLAVRSQVLGLKFDLEGIKGPFQTDAHVFGDAAKGDLNEGLSKAKVSSANGPQNVTGPAGWAVPDVKELPELKGVCSVEMPPAPTATNPDGEVFTGTTDTEFPITDSRIKEIKWIYDDGRGHTLTQTQKITWTFIDVSTTTEGLTLTANNTRGRYQWIDCTHNNVPLKGETARSLSAPGSGSYAVEITEGNCVFISECVKVSSNGSEDEGASEIKIYPNPSNGQFVLDMGEGVASKVVIFNKRGKVESSLDNVQRHEFNLSVKPGKYMMGVMVGNRLEEIELVIY